VENDKTYTAFAGQRLIASGNLKTTVLGAKEFQDGGENALILVFEDQSGGQIDFDLRGTPDEVLARLSSHPWFASSDAQTQVRTGPGRPKLGVQCREVSLLPRHWEWLEQQPGGISVALRKLVEESRKGGQGLHLARVAREAAGKFMWAMTGNLPNFEEASRVLYAKDYRGLEPLIRDWPEDIRKHVERLVAEAARLEQEASGGPRLHTDDV